MIERKCYSCGVWNKEEDYCTSCSVAISPLALDKEKEKKKQIEEANRKPPILEVYRRKAENSPHIIVRILYRMVYSFLLFMALIGAFLAWLTAIVNA